MFPEFTHVLGIEPLFFSIALFLFTVLAKISRTVWKRSLPAKMLSVVHSGFGRAKVVPSLSVRV